MRYVLAMAFALAVAVSAVVPAAQAQMVNKYGNTVVPLGPGAGGGGACYVDGVARSCAQPAAVTLYLASDSETVAGPSAPARLSFQGGDRN